jgi:hypothetical protein
MKRMMILAFLFAAGLIVQVVAQIPVPTLVRISRAEDELRFDKTLESLMKRT